jgi:shikimate dehydrogenase
MSQAPRAFIVGHPVAQSRSPLIHGQWLREFGLAGSYEKIAVRPEDLAGFVRGMRDAGFVGGNVTVPHKAEIMALADDVDDAARAIGAANTLWFEDGRLMAGNTDVTGFLANLDEEAPGWDRPGGNAVVLGAGGAARAVIHGLLQRGFAVDIVNRTRGRGEALAAECPSGVRAWSWDDLARPSSAAALLVNTTSLGMEGQPPLGVDLRVLHRDALVTDIVYSPLETPLLRNAGARGHRTVGGLGMLLHQAVPGFERWFGIRPSVTPQLRSLVEADIPRR